MRDGIDMLFCDRVGSDRGLVQAINRICRYNEKGSYYKVPALDDLIAREKMYATFMGDQKQ